ncbi:MAG: pyridoxamine 5'-phosphate oxidase family protein [Clostridia bacterium]|nr:pyridoxamine 5'-phosphate oxidase family protein [Clostridia bacterium]
MSNGLTRRELEITDINEIIKILDKSLIAHIGMVDGDEPYVVPMNYGYTMENEKLTIYLHGARKGRKIDVLRANPKVFFETECDIQPFEGEIACKYGMAYASIMGKGVATIVEDVEEKKKGMSVIMKTQTGKDFSFEDKMVSFVNIIRIDVETYTAKHRPIPQR